MSGRELAIALALMFLCRGLAPEGPTRQPPAPPRIRLQPSPMVHVNAATFDSVRATMRLRVRPK